MGLRDGNAVNPAPRAMTRTSVTALGGPDPYAAWRCAWCKRTWPVASLARDHAERCELRPDQP